MKKIGLIFVPVFLVSLLCYSVLTPAAAMSRDISRSVFRLHILANSDSDTDQVLKLRVRDALLEETAPLFKNCRSIGEAVTGAEAHIDDLKRRARAVIAFSGFDYDVKIYTAREFFNARSYEDFTLPPGYYQCLKVVIGEGKGKNWWCVMYPAVCLSGCSDDFTEALSEDELHAIRSGHYVVRFKLLEIYERMRSKMK